MAITAPPKTTNTRSKTSQKQTARRIAQQIAQEPLEVLKTAGEQAVGGQRQTLSEEPRKEQSQGEQKPDVLEKKKYTVLQALQNEIAEIGELSKKRQEEMRARWREQEELREKRQKEAKKASKPLLEPMAKIKRGILGGMQKIGLKRKQRQVELAKTPSN